MPTVLDTAMGRLFSSIEEGQRAFQAANIGLLVSPNDSSDLQMSPAQQFSVNKAFIWGEHKWGDTNQRVALNYAREGLTDVQ